VRSSSSSSSSSSPAIGFGGIGFHHATVHPPHRRRRPSSFLNFDEFGDRIRLGIAIETEGSDDRAMPVEVIIGCWFGSLAARSRRVSYDSSLLGRRRKHACLRYHGFDWLDSPPCSVWFRRVGVGRNYDSLETNSAPAMLVVRTMDSVLKKWRVVSQSYHPPPSPAVHPCGCDSMRLDKSV